jgi:ribA/ribD-fused uncharacterized protein
MNDIKGFFGEYRWLSNFWYAPIVIENITFPTNEHAYQAAKCVHMKDVITISKAKTPALAKTMGNRVDIKPNWNDIKIDVMRVITAAKYDQHPDLKQKLLGTKGMELVELNNWYDTFWGMCGNKGHNWLGRILMDYRDNP